MSLRLLSVNARSLPNDRSAAALIAEAQVDIACVHGAPNRLRWRSSCAALGRESGLVVVGGGRTGGGNLLLSSLGVNVEATRDLRFAGGRGPSPAGAELSVLSRLGHRFAFAGARLLGDAGERAGQAAELIRTGHELVPDAPPALLCVEGVEGAGTASWDALADGRKPVGVGIFIDAAVTIDDVDQLGGGTGIDRPTRITLTLD